MTQQLPPDVIAQLTAMGPMITPELVQGSWALLTPFHQKAGDAPSATVSTLDGLLDCQVPLLFAVAQQDPPFSHAQVAALTAAWFARHGSVPQLVWSEGHNHISQIGSIGVDDLALGAQLARFVNRVTSPSSKSRVFRTVPGDSARAAPAGPLPGRPAGQELSVRRGQHRDRRLPGGRYDRAGAHL